MPGRTIVEIKVESLKRCELVTMSGEIDSDNALELEQKLVDLVEAGQRNIVLNFQDVTYIASPGIKALLVAQIKAKRRVPRGEVVICELSPRMKDILEIVGLHYLFKFYEQAAEAVGSF
jgi:anti-sigma B factor antagonist